MIKSRIDCFEMISQRVRQHFPQLTMTNKNIVTALTCTVAAVAVATIYRPVETMVSLALAGCLWGANTAAASYRRVERPQIHIASFLSGGFGDLRCGINLAQQLLARADNRAEITVVTDSPADMRTLATGENCPNIVNVKDQATLQANPPHLCIQIPVGQASRRTSYLPKTSHWTIVEYGGDIFASSQGTEYIMGLRDNELGVFVHKELQDWSRQFAPGMPVQDLSLLNELSSQHLKDHILCGKSIDAYTQTNQLYYAYVSNMDTPAKVVLAFASKEKATGRQLDLVIPGRRLTDDRLSSNLFGAMGNAAPHYLALGYNHIEVHRCLNDGTWDVKSAIANQDGKWELGQGDETRRTIRVILTNIIPNSDCKILMKASDDFCAITGDQSYSEGASAGKTFIYEALDHKLLFKRSMIELGQQTSSEQLKEFMEHMRRFEINYEYRPDTYVALGELAALRETRVAFRQFCEAVCKRDVVKRIAALIKQKFG